MNERRQDCPVVSLIDSGIRYARCGNGDEAEIIVICGWIQQCARMKEKSVYPTERISRFVYQGTSRTRHTHEAHFDVDAEVG